MAVRHVHRALAHEAPRGRVCDLRAHPGRIYRSVPDGGGVAARGLQLRLPGSRVPTDRYVALRFGRVWAEGMERGPTATCGRGCRIDPGETLNGGGPADIRRPAVLLRDPSRPHLLLRPGPATHPRHPRYSSG